MITLDRQHALLKALQCVCDQMRIPKELSRSISDELFHCFCQRALGERGEINGQEFADDLLRSIVKTTFFSPASQKRGVISFRIDPIFLWKYVPSEEFPVLPYGIFFFVSDAFLGVHVRFQEIARGGLRTVFLANPSLRKKEALSIFFECYHLALTQDKKNKDIAEGGGKGVLFYLNQLKPKEEDEALFSCQKEYVEELLALVNMDETSGKLRDETIVDYLGVPEYIYLGPDERMKSYAIEWISQYAVRVQYRCSSAFMSSKLGAGIHHKTYGVTSHGLMAWLEASMRVLFRKNIREVPFWMTMTGGPDGDLGSNMIKLIARECPKTGHFVAMKDKSAVAYDPKGLNMAELLHLVEEEEPIGGFRKEFLSKKGWIVRLVEENGSSRYEMVRVEGDCPSMEELARMYNEALFKIHADVFLPAGGRPGTISLGNIHLCFHAENNVDDLGSPDGKPSFPLVVEGANLFFTKEAREVLEKEGVWIVKDSSANKGGVIASSHEVLCGLIVQDDEFLTHKERIVQEVLARIRESCLLEARCLFQGSEGADLLGRKSLVAKSLMISNAILATRAAIRPLLDRWDPRVSALQQQRDVFSECLLAYALPILREKYRDRVLFELPLLHQRAIVSAFLASSYVYMFATPWVEETVDALVDMAKEILKTHLTQNLTIAFETTSKIYQQRVLGK